MPVRYRRPDPADVVAARDRLVRLHGGRGEHGPVAAVAAEAPAPASPATAATVSPSPAVSAPVAAPSAAAPVPAASSGRLPAVVSGWVERIVPAALRGARLDPGWPGVLAIGFVVVVAVALAAFVVWRARPHAIVVSAAPVPIESPAAPSAGPTVVVAVAGGVRRPGLVTLPAGARVADALRAAEGVRPGVDIGLLNLARRLVDGEQVVVGRAAAGSAAGPTAPGQAGGPVNLNTATVEQLDALPGVGRVLAARVIAFRTQHGGFRSVDQLREVNGIGEAKFADLRPLVSV